MRFGHLQLPDCLKGQRQNHRIEYDVGNLHPDEEVRLSDAVTRDVGLPCLSDRIALKGTEEVIHKKPEDHEDADDSRLLAESLGGEDALVVEQYGNLDGGDGDSVELGRGVDSLFRRSQYDG